MLHAILPIILLLGLGYALRQCGFLQEAGWRALERISYYVFFPALIVKVLQGADLSGVPLGFSLSLVLAQLLMGVIGLAALLLYRARLSSVGSIIQSNVRWNTFVALAICQSLFGAEGLALVAIASAVLIPFANLISVTALLRYSEKDNAVEKSVLRGLVRNPLLIACAIGIGLSVTEVPLPLIILETIELLSRPAIALGLVTAGAGVTFKALQSDLTPTMFWSILRLAAFPVLAVLIGFGFGLSGIHLTVIAICCATPTAVNSYILAKELGGNADLAANLISVQTVLSALTLPVTILIMQSLTSA